MNAYYLSLLKEIQKQIDDKSYQTAYDLIHQELELPYVPKEAMEALEEYQKECLSHMDRLVRSADDEQLQAWIQGSLQQQEKAVSLLQNLNLRNYHDEVQTLLDSKLLDEYKGELIESLMEQKIDDSYIVIKNGLEITFIPSSIISKDEDDVLIRARELFDQWFSNNNPAFQNFCNRLLEQEVLEVRPFDFMDQDPVVTYNANDNTYTITTADGQSRTYSAISDQNMDTKLEKNGTWHFFLEDDVAEPKDYSTVYVPSFVGNSKLTELTELTEDQAAELAQVLRDCADSSISDYLSFDEDGNLVYNGEGIYTFDMQGKTYFTTEKDLYNSMQTQNDYEKPIDVQEKLAYYNATYVQKKIEETNHALLETDGNGRFTSVKFDDDSVVYSLNVESVTDEDAYQDAMNEYNYKIQEYEKIIADINAQTSIIQQEDRTLELRLKQLDTEQNALATEMDAVKKVIQDNVEKTFKTFSD